MRSQEYRPSTASSTILASGKLDRFELCDIRNDPYESQEGLHAQGTHTSFGTLDVEAEFPERRRR
ncbi:MAG: hypothetical protein ACE5F1_09245 [Planctomycetota bacterium]